MHPLSFSFSFSHIEVIKARLCGIISSAKQGFLKQRKCQVFVRIICTLEAVPSCCLYEECEADIMLTWTDHFQRSDRIVSSRWHFFTGQLSSRNSLLFVFNPHWIYYSLEGCCLTPITFCIFVTVNIVITLYKLIAHFILLCIHVQFKKMGEAAKMKSCTRNYLVF